MKHSDDDDDDDDDELMLYRRRLPVAMPAKNDFSVWSILKQCVGKVSRYHAD